MPARPDDGLLRVRVQPRASRAAIGTWREDGTLTVRVTAPPVEGRANAAVGALLATALGVPVSAVRVVHGEHGRDKLVRVTGLSPAEIRRKLEGEGR
ncbi:MAG: hypothetical protein DMD76_03325 [Candidatus Rokuibacteriota bacterium]|nr:MAG: hypothetical protein DMD76_03325 [Candidatus Rokubacteria bacterium]